jgi:hypothetical protein
MGELGCVGHLTTNVMEFEGERWILFAVEFRNTPVDPIAFRLGSTFAHLGALLLRNGWAEQSWRVLLLPLFSSALFLPRGIPL